MCARTDDCDSPNIRPLYILSWSKWSINFLKWDWFNSYCLLLLSSQKELKKLPKWTMVSFPSASTAYALKLLCNTSLCGCKINLKLRPNVWNSTSLMMLNGWVLGFVPRLTILCWTSSTCKDSKCFKFLFNWAVNRGKISQLNVTCSCQSADYIWVWPALG